MSKCCQAAVELLTWHIAHYSPGAALPHDNPVCKLWSWGVARRETWKMPGQTGVLWLRGGGGGGGGHTFLLYKRLSGCSLASRGNQPWDLKDQHFSGLPTLLSVKFGSDRRGALMYIVFEVLINGESWRLYKELDAGKVITSLHRLSLSEKKSKGVTLLFPVSLCIFIYFIFWSETFTWKMN